MKSKIVIILSAAAVMFSSCRKDNYVIPIGSDAVPSEKTVVAVKKNADGKWQMTVNNKPYYVNGAATNRFYNDVAKFGGNTIRLYSPTDANTMTIMDEAYQNGLMVYLGLGMSAAEYMDYTDAAKVAAQKEKIMAWVKQYMHHPALLCWSIGNEIEASNDNNMNLWKAVGDIADSIRELDPDHPITCTLAGSGEARVRNLAACSKAIDLISVNAYYPVVSNIPANMAAAGVDLPYLVTEFGPRGTWAMSPEPGRILPWSDYYSGSSKALVEETSTEKAEVYFSVWKNDIKANEAKGCLGSFIFVWGYQSHGEVLNWYGTHTKDRYAFGCCDKMQECWTGKAPSSPAPCIASRKDMTMNGKVAEDAIYVSPGSDNTASVVATSPSGLNLRYHWFVYRESDKESDGSIPAGIKGLIEDDSLSRIKFKAPNGAGAYRLYVYVLDDVSKKAASACIPFCVK